MISTTSSKEPHRDELILRVLKHWHHFWELYHGIYLLPVGTEIIKTQSLQVIWFPFSPYRVMDWWLRSESNESRRQSALVPQFFHHQCRTQCSACSWTLQCIQVTSSGLDAYYLQGYKLEGLWSGWEYAQPKDKSLLWPSVALSIQRQEISIVKIVKKRTMILLQEN